VVRKTLVDSDIEAARDLLEALSQRGFPVSHAFWRLLEEPEGWFLYLASPLYGKKGQAELYREIDSVLTEQKISIELHRIKVIDPNRPPMIGMVRELENMPPLGSQPFWYTSSSTSTGVSPGPVVIYPRQGREPADP